MIDATRVSDGALVSIKSVERSTNEIPIARSLSSANLLHDPHNHCVPILDVLNDPVDSTRSLMVMPYLRPFNDPEFLYLVEAIDFMDQMLQVSCRSVTFTLAHSKVVLGTRIYA